MGYWRDYPPTHLLVRAYLGAGESGGARGAASAGHSEKEMDAFFAALGGGNG